MDCARFEELASFSTVPPAEAEAFEEHCRTCAVCARSRAAFAVARAAVPSPVAGELFGFAGRTRSRWLRERVAPSTSPVRTAAAVGALAAAAAAAVVLVLDRAVPATSPSVPSELGPGGAPAAAAAEPEEEEDLFPTVDDPLATLSDDELSAIEELIDEIGPDLEAGT